MTLQLKVLGKKLCVCLLVVAGFSLFTGEVVFERSEQMPDDGDAPGPAQQLLPGAAAHVGHIGVVDGEAEDPAGRRALKS